MKIKELKVFKSKGLVFAQFWSKFKNSTSGWSKTARALFQIYFYTELFKYLVTFLRKTWTAGRASLKFCVLSNQVVLRKTLENKNFACPALLSANISQIFFSHLDIWRYLLLFFSKILFNWSPHFITSFSKPFKIQTDSCTAEMGFQLVPKYLKESETAKICSPKYFYLK